MKKLLALLLAVVMALGISACGKSEPADSEAPKAQTEETNAKDAQKEQLETPEEEAAEIPSEEADQQTEEKVEENVEKKEDKKTTTPSATPSKPAEKPADTPAKVPEQEPAKEPEQEPVKEETPAPASKTVGNQLLDEFKSKANSGSAYSVANSLASSSTLPFAAGAMEVTPGYLAGFDNAEITGFKSGAVFQPMIGSIAFIGYVFELEDGVSASEFISTLRSNANLRWNICVEAEEMVTGSSGNKVFFVMCPKTFEE